MARLFEQSTEATPGDLSDRLAYGKTATPTKNITWTNLVSWLNSVLGFLKISSNLSDLNNTTTARSNLDVYSTTEIDDALDLKADESSVLTKTNTTSYTPTSDYHPATKLYTDLRSTSGVGTLSNVGGTSSASPLSLVTNRKRIVVVTATNTNRFYFISTAGAIAGDELIIKADGNNSVDVAIVTTNTDLTEDKGLSPRDAAIFIYSGAEWLIISLNNN